MVSAVILAAGAARRMGKPKQLLPVGERPMVWQVANQACEAGLPEVVVVTGAYAPEVEHALTGLPVRIVYNEYWPLGQSTSVRTGLQALGDAKGVLFLLADQPLVDSCLIKGLVASYRKGGASILVPRANGRPGTPVLFDLSHWAQTLLALSGDEGARRIIATYPEAVRYHEVEDESIFFDADTIEEYEKLLRLWEARKQKGICPR